MGSCDCSHASSPLLWWEGPLAIQICKLLGVLLRIKSIVASRLLKMGLWTCACRSPVDWPDALSNHRLVQFSWVERGVYRCTLSKFSAARRSWTLEYLRNQLDRRGTQGKETQRRIYVTLWVTSRFYMVLTRQTQTHHSSVVA